MLSGELKGLDFCHKYPVETSLIASSETLTFSWVSICPIPMMGHISWSILFAFIFLVIILDQSEVLFVPLINGLRLLEA